MEYAQILDRRQSTRKYKTEQLNEEQISYILKAANCAPVGSRMYQDVHITIVQDQEKLLKLCEAAWERFSSKEKVKEIAGKTVTDQDAARPKPNLFYGAPTVFFLSHRRQTLQPGIEWANVTSIVNQMHLAALDLGLGSVYMWGALESMRMLPELDHTDLLELPEDFEPLLALAVGYPEDELPDRKPLHEGIAVNVIA